MDFKSLFNDTFHESLSNIQDPFWFANKFCHYTNLSGLIGILESNQIWLSDHRFLNDEQEIAYGRDLAVRTISEIAASELNQEFATFLRKIIDQIVKPSNYASYIGSMSLAIDALDQWKWYGASTEGVCIVFDGEQSLWNNGHSHPTHIRQRRIIYKETDQVALIEKFISIYKSHFLEFKSFQDPFVNDLAWLIQDQFIAFKDSQYESEQEIRLTIENLTQILAEKKPIHRVAKSLVIPYITTGYISKESDFKPQKLPVTEIIVNPQAKQDMVASIQAYLINKGYDTIPIRSSKLKFRG